MFEYDLKACVNKISPWINKADRPTLVFNLNSNDHEISNFIEKLDPPLICLSVICWICYLMNHCYFIIFFKKEYVLFHLTSGSSGNRRHQQKRQQKIVGSSGNKMVK